MIRQRARRAGGTGMKRLAPAFLRRMLVDACHPPDGVTREDPKSEYQFAPPRLWRFDLAWPAARVAVEFQGGAWVYGRHQRPAGFEADCEKFCAAAARGWLVLPVTYGMLRENMDQVVGRIAQAIAMQRPSEVAEVVAGTRPAMAKTEWEDE